MTVALTKRSHPRPSLMELAVLVTSLSLACGDGGPSQDTDSEPDEEPTTGDGTTAGPTAGGSGIEATTAALDDTAGSDSEPSGTSGEPTGTDDTTGGAFEGVLEIHRIGRWAPAPLAERFGEGAAEIAAFDPLSQRLFLTNSMDSTIDVLDISYPPLPMLVDSIPITDPMLATPTSIAVHDGVLAMVVPSTMPAAPGRLFFFDVDGTELASVIVGVGPDMVKWSDDGTTVITANEGEPTGYGPGDVDPEGTVSIVDVSAGPQSVTQLDVVTAGFGAFGPGDLDDTTLTVGPGAWVAQDMEPEHVTMSTDGSTAFVTLQENNALAIVDVASATVTDVVGLGVVDHMRIGLDPSDQDAGIAIATHPVFGMRQPDGIAAFEVDGSTYLVTANEGAPRHYPGFHENVRVASQPLDPVVFPDAAALQEYDALGSLYVSAASGDIDDDGDLDRLWAFGTRSITIFDASGAEVWDSGDAIEQATAAAFPMDFNSASDANGSFDTRSDDGGPEPEGLVIGSAFGTTYVFVGLEQMGGFMVWELDDPHSPVEWGYINPRDFTGDPAAGTADDLGPEGLLFVSDTDSPTGNPLLVVSNEVSGSVSIYELSLVPE